MQNKPKDFKKPFFSLTSKASILALAMLALPMSTIHVPLQAQPSPQPTETLGLDEKALESIEVDSDQVLFSAFGTDFTAGEYTNMIRYSPPSPFGRINSIDFSLNDFSARIVKKAIQDYAIQREAYNRTLLEGLTPTPDLSDMVASQNERMLQLVWLENKGILAPMTVTDEEIQAEYDNIKDAQLKVDEALELRHIFLSAYEEYTVQEGDSLESIAQKISGDEAQAAKILNSELPRSPRSEPTTDSEGNEVPPKALTAGEIVLVPMNAEKRAQIAQKAEDAYTRLTLGEDFITVAKDFGDNSSEGRAVKLMPEKSSRPLLPEFVEAFHSVKDGEFSKPFETKHGYQILQRVSYTPKGYKPLEEVRTEVKNRVETIRRNELYKQLIDSLWAEYDGVKINEEALMNAEKPEFENEIIFTIDDFNFPGSMFKRDFGSKVTPEMTFQERRALLSTVPIISRTISKWDIDRNNLADTEIYKKRSELVTATTLFPVYQRHYLEDLHPFEPTEADYQAKYDELSEQIANQPTATVWKITVSPEGGLDSSTQEGLDALNALRASVEAKIKENNVTDAASFEALAKILSEDEYAPLGGKIGPVNQFYDDGLGAQLVSKQRENTLYGPLFRGNKVVAFWIGDIVEVEKPELDSVRSALKKELERDHQRKVMDMMNKELLEDANLKLMPPLDEVAE